jgi:acyl carrier protein
MEKFEEAIAEILEVDIVNSEDKLVDFECWDSLTLLSIIALTDQKYHVNLSAAEVLNANTIGDLKELIKGKIK